MRSPARFGRKLSPLAALCCLVGCGPPPGSAQVFSFATPRALTVECANPPADLDAELWISGNREACPMTVDQVAGTTTGSCEVAPGRVRTATLDWFVGRPSPQRESVRVLLAQAQQEIDVTDPDGGTVTLRVNDEDIVIEDCLDVRDDPAAGVDTVRLGEQLVPVCDLDRSCAQDAAPACTNIGEVCAGTDPFVP